MKSEAVSKTKSETKPANPFFVEARHLVEEMEKLYKDIADRAFKLFERRGGTSGNDHDDWLQAEAEMLKKTEMELSETDAAYKLRVEAPGFKAENLKVSVEPKRILINGNVETSEERTEDKVIYSERRANRIFRSLALPGEVEASAATAVLKDGILEVTLPKAVVEEKATVEVKSE